MGFALLKKDSSEDVADGVSMTDRLRAWWNGDELDADVFSEGGGGESAGEVVGNGTDAKDVGPSPVGGENPWSDTRRQLAQEVWSHGFVVPGGTDYIEKLVSGCSLTSAETMLEIGVGMGGGTRTIIGKFGNYVTGYERSPNLAAAAMRHAVTYEIDDKLEVTALPFEKLSLKSKIFRAALLRDVLYTMEDKVGLISKVGDSLKSGESFLIMTDFLFDAGNDASELTSWQAGEERPVYPCTKAALVNAIENADLQLRIIDDESDDYCAMVVDAWSEHLKTIDGAEISPEMGQELKREGDFWARRVAALKSGALHYYRIEAVKIS